MSDAAIPYPPAGTSQTQAEMMQQPQAAPEITTTRWAPSVLSSILPSSNAMAMDPVPMGLGCLVGPKGHTTVWAQLRSQINVWIRRNSGDHRKRDVSSVRARTTRSLLMRPVHWCVQRFDQASQAWGSTAGSGNSRNLEDNMIHINRMSWMSNFFQSRPVESCIKAKRWSSPFLDLTLRVVSRNKMIAFETSFLAKRMPHLSCPHVCSVLVGKTRTMSSIIETKSTPTTTPKKHHHQQYKTPFSLNAHI